MKNMMMISAVVLMSLAASAQGKGKEAHGANAVNIDNKCAADAAPDKANCGTEKVGTGLIKCLHAYIKAGKSVSPDCAAALETAKETHQAKKAGK